MIQVRKCRTVTATVASSEVVPIAASFEVVLTLEAVALLWASAHCAPLWHPSLAMQLSSLL